MFSIDEISQEITAIRADFGFPTIVPRMKEIEYKKEQNKLWIIAEDRADKSNIIGYGKVVAELRKRLGVRSITVVSNLDLVKRKEILTKNLQSLQDDPVSVRLGEYIKNELNRENKGKKFPKMGKSLVTPCRNLHAITLSEILGFDPIILSVRLTYPTLARKCESVIIEEKVENCDQCREITREKAAEYAKKNNIPIVFGDFPEEIHYDGTIMINPTTFFWLSRWKRKTLTTTNERCIREKNDTFLTKTLWEVYEGLCEPKWGSNDIYRYYKGSV
jgi:hypothetical protein